MDTFFLDTWQIFGIQYPSIYDHPPKIEKLELENWEIKRAAEIQKKKDEEKKSRVNIKKAEWLKLNAEMEELVQRMDGVKRELLNDEVEKGYFEQTAEWKYSESWENLLS